MSISDNLRIDVNHEFEQFKLGDGSNLAEIWVRRFLVAGTGVLLWLVTDQALMLIWAVGYLLLDGAYVAYLRSQSQPVSTKHLIIAMLANIAVAAWFGSMAVCVTAMGEGEYLLLATCACAGMALHCISCNHHFSYSATIDLSATVVTSIGVLIGASLKIEPMLVRIATLFGGIGIVLYFTLSFRNIVRERQSLNRRLEAEKQDDKMRALGQFTSGVAHDFNNLLTVVNGNIELAKIDPEGIDAFNYLEEAHAAGLKGAVLIQQLLAFARKSKIVVSDIDLSDLFSHLQGLLDRVLPAHITLTILHRKQNVRVRGDVAMLESAIINLVINARDAMKKQSGEIVISIRPHGSNEVEIAVMDSGPGMDSDTLSRATEPFFTTKAVGEGSGLGLSMVTGVVTQCGGRFELKNRPGRGLSAIIYLPVADGVASRRIPLEDVTGPT